jgi:hypothetical protein
MNTLLVSQVNLPDEADRKLYDVAEAAGAILVTGNKKHYPDEPFTKDPAEFMAESRTRWHENDTVVN